MSSKNKKGGPGILGFGIAFFVFSSIIRSLGGFFGIFAFLFAIAASVGVGKLIKKIFGGLDTTTHNREDTMHQTFQYQQNTQQTAQQGNAQPGYNQQTYQYQQQQSRPVATGNTYRQATQKPVQQEEPESLKKVKTDTGNAEVDALLKQGREMIKEIRAENALIPDSSLTDKLNQLEEQCAELFRAVYEKPSKASQIRKFMDYYLPTTLKMVKAYRVLDNRGISKTQMNQARDRIDSALGVVVSGCQKMLDNLYREDVLDITTDIDVLEQMLKRDGLTESDLEKAAQQAREAARIDMEVNRLAKERAEKARQEAEAAQAAKEAQEAADSLMSESEKDAIEKAEPAVQTYYYRTSTGVDQRVNNSVASAQAHIPEAPTIYGGTYQAGAAAAQSVEKK